MGSEAFASYIQNLHRPPVASIVTRHALPRGPTTRSRMLVHASRVVSVYLCFMWIRSDHETVNRFVGDKSIHNLCDIRDANSPVKKVIGFDQNRHASGALIETTRCANARL